MSNINNIKLNFRSPNSRFQLFSNVRKMAKKLLSCAPNNILIMYLKSTLNAEFKLKFK